MRAALLGFLLIFLAAPAWADNEKATQKYAARAYKMLELFDSFKDHPVFALCGYGCGEDSPGRIWAETLKKQGARAKEKGAALPVCVAFENMRTMGLDYAKGNKKDAAIMRKMIEETLADYAE